MNRRRVGITGLGVVSVVGTGKARFWDALANGRTGFAPVSSFDVKGWRTEVGAEVKGPGPREALEYARLAAQEAFSDAGLDPARVDKGRAGVALGTTSGESVLIEGLMASRLAGDPGPLKTGSFERSPASIPAGVAGDLGWLGPNAMLTTACAAGNFALAWAYDSVAEGRADVMLAGGVDVFGRLTFAGFNRLLAVAPKVCAPFSKGRAGLIPAEGCAVLLLEDMDAALARKARVYAELLGCGMSSDASHPTIPDPRGIARAMRSCLGHAGLEPSDVDYISAHGTGTRANDKAETAAIKEVFGERSSRVPVSSIKSMLGHAMGAASALEAAASCLAVSEGLIPPTMNFTPGDPACDLDYVPNKSRRADLKVVLSNASAFGGSNAVVAFSRPGLRPEPAHPSVVRVAVTGLGSVEEGDPEATLERFAPGLAARNRGPMDAPVAYALSAAKLAFDDAGLGSGALGENGGVVLDSTGEVESQYLFFEALERGGPQGVEPFQFPIMLANAAASRTAIGFGLALINKSFGGCFPAGEGAVGDAWRLVRGRPGSVVLAGGVGRGAGLLVLEDLDRARRRGARLYAEIEGYEEGFAPGECAPPHSSPRAMVDAVRSLKGPLEWAGKGFHGAWARLKLKPVEKGL